MLRHRLRRMEDLIDRLGGALGRGRPAPGPRPLQTAQDVIDLLQEQVDLLRADPSLGVVEKARAIGYLAGLARKALETGALADRLEMLEVVLKQRQPEGKR